jgi:hypothetical protein
LNPHAELVNPHAELVEASELIEASTKILFIDYLSMCSAEKATVVHLFLCADL